MGDHTGLSKVTTDSGQEMICANTGSCSRRSARMTMLRVTYPKQGSNGKVEIVEVKDEKAATPAQNGTQDKKAEEAAKENKADTISVESL